MADDSVIDLCSSSEEEDNVVATVQETLQQINSSLKASGRHYKGYSCKTVSWDDVQRGTVGGNLSCWGANITDTRLWAKDGRSLFTVRGDNWNERLGKVNADQIALVANDNQGYGPNLQPYTLRTFLKDPERFAGYAGLTAATTTDLSDADLDKEISVRFQTTFLPVGEEKFATLEFAPEAYNYNTQSDEDPRNLILLCTTQGLAVQQDGAGAKKLYHHHAVQKTTRVVDRHWLEAERSRHAVGGSQQESKEEREDALARGKATASVIGIAGMGTRFNALMTIQIPLKQKVVHARRGCWMETAFAIECSAFECSESPQIEEGFGGGGGGYGGGFSISSKQVLHKSRKRKKSSFGGGGRGGGAGRGAGRGRGGGRGFGTPKPQGASNAARVSKGSFVDSWSGLTVKNPERHPSEHVTVTIVLYYVCSGGVPTPEDVRSAVDDLEDMYASLESGCLAESKFDFMKTELTVKNMQDIQTKLVTQPPPKPAAVANWNVFPRS